MSLNKRLLAAALLSIADSQARNVAAEPLVFRNYDTGPMPVFLRRDKFDRAEAKRARKAQIKRNGGMK